MTLYTCTKSCIYTGDVPLTVLQLYFKVALDLGRGHILWYTICDIVISRAYAPLSVHVASRVQTWAEECVHLHEVLKIEICIFSISCRVMPPTPTFEQMNSAHIRVACPLFFYTPLSCPLELGTEESLCLSFLVILLGLSSRVT